MVSIISLYNLFTLSSCFIFWSKKNCVECRRMWNQRLQRQESRRRGRSRSLPSKESISMLFSICLLMTLSSSSLLVFAEGKIQFFFKKDFTLLCNGCFLCLFWHFALVWKLFRFSRGLTRKPMALIKKLRKAVSHFYLSVGVVEWLVMLFVVLD